jgi:hypothetical protein
MLHKIQNAQLVRELAYRGLGHTRKNYCGNNCASERSSLALEQEHRAFSPPAPCHPECTSTERRLLLQRDFVSSAAIHTSLGTREQGDHRTATTSDLLCPQSRLFHPPQLSRNYQQKHLAAKQDKHGEKWPLKFCLRSISFILTGFFNLS